MRRVWIVALIMALVIAGCGGPAADTTVPDPPKATIFEKSGVATVDTVIERWKNDVPAEMKTQGVKDTPEQPIVQKVYQSTASLQEIADFYKTLTEKGWIEAPKMPGIQDNILIAGYENGNTTLSIGALDATKFGGSGVVVYTAKGTK
jgi:hypothetical protein